MPLQKKNLLTIVREKENTVRSTIKDWPENERPREKFLNNGMDFLTAAELLAIIIGSGTGNASALDIAKNLLIEHKSLRTISILSVEELMQYKGIGKARAVSIASVFELARRLHALPTEKKKSICSPEDVFQQFSPLLQDKKQEVFMMLSLNNSGKLIKSTIITKGLLNSSLVHPREVFRQAILDNAASVILLHNHPSGNKTPSEDDILITKQLIHAGRVVGIPVNDHIIIAGNEYVSFVEEGLL